MAPPPEGTPQVRTLRMRRIDRIGDALFRGLARLGIGPGWSLTLAAVAPACRAQSR